MPGASKIPAVMRPTFHDFFGRRFADPTRYQIPHILKHVIKFSTKNFHPRPKHYTVLKLDDLVLALVMILLSTYVF